jgi:hypothetical protein
MTGSVVPGVIPQSPAKEIGADGGAEVNEKAAYLVRTSTTRLARDHGGEVGRIS